MFLCSPDADKICIANQEEEIGFSFNAVDTDFKSVAFYLGNLRSTLGYRNWGQRFTAQELKVIHIGRTFFSSIKKPRMIIK